MSSPRRVLVVDDDDEVRALLAEYLQTLGFEVLQAANGLEALLQVKRHQPEAVVIDRIEGYVRSLRQEQTTQDNTLRMDIQRNQAATPAPNTGPNAVAPIGGGTGIGR